LKTEADGVSVTWISFGLRRGTLLKTAVVALAMDAYRFQNYLSFFFYKSVILKIFGRKGEEVTEEWR
jgi:hypothetical protein